MRILHCCLAAFYIDNYGYQENILPKMHKIQGHDVRIVASTETYLGNKNLGYVQASAYMTAENIPITRIPYIKYLPHRIARKLRIYRGLTKELTAFKPDIIFLHDVQFLSIREIAKYAKQNSVIIYADCHTDFINSGKNWISKNILHKLIYKRCAKLIEPYVKKFYGVLPIRAEFLKSVYKIDAKKVDVLELGVDDTMINLSNRFETRRAIRNKYNINENDFVIITGGKIDRRKNIHLLLKAFEQIERPNLKLVIFGSISDEINQEIHSITDNRIIKTGWLSVDDTNKILIAADLGFFPGTHSTLWEQSIGLGLPCVFKRWIGIEHVDLGGNCILLDDVTTENLESVIKKVITDTNLYLRMDEISKEKGIEKFSYSKIAQRAIEQ